MTVALNDDGDLRGIHTRFRVAGVVVAAVVLAGVQACADPTAGSPDPAAPDSSALPADWPSRGGQPVREVPMPSGQLLGYVPETTIGHVLCKALSDAEWASALGGQVRTEVNPYYQCHAISARFEVTAKVGTESVTGTGTIAGNPADTDEKSSSTDVEVEIVPSEEQDRYRDLATTLEVSVALRDTLEDDPDGQTARIGTDIAESILRRTTGPGPRLPELNDDDELATVAARPPMPGYGVADQPLPLAAEQLCTVLAEALGTDVTRTSTAEPDGACDVEGGNGRIGGRLSNATGGTSYGTRIAGRPANWSNSGSVEIRLRDDSPQSVILTGVLDRSEFQNILTAIVPKLAGR